MSAIKDKKLLLLGILSEHSTHGYQLNELLKSISTPIRIGKANAYQLLSRFEKEGLVTAKEERKAPYPPRTVYSISEKGRAEFTHLLETHLSEHVPTEYPDGISLNFIATLPPSKSVTLLTQRAERLAARCDAFQAFSDDIRASHPGLDLMIQQLELERKFTDELIEKLKQE